MELQTLRLFRVIALEGSFSKAAQKLNYAQSNLSVKMAQFKTMTISAVHRRTRFSSISRLPVTLHESMKMNGSC